ncbi:hypothetical protein HHI36_015531 [Cryptolaemus montrouzieri]|uniref:Uncharacterized protein n=1 Tax=Cryptolaemus montrouzieri TaxID=559131 RepID=A0ABD2N6C3_9CUCU
MKKLVSMGSFGKASLSRSYPQFDGTMEKPQLIRKRQYLNRKKLSDNLALKNTEKVIVLPDSDDDDKDYFTNLQAIYEIDRCGEKETVNLMLEEAFFLQRALGCLNIFYENELLDHSKAWELFSEILYKDGPAYHHASYVVLIQEHEKGNLDTSLMGLHRMCETAGKELLICQVYWPNDEVNPDNLSNIRIKEILMKRWISSQERQETT